MTRTIIIAGLASLLALLWVTRVTGNDSARLSAEKLYYGQRKLSVNLLRAIQKNQPNKNVFFSPHSIHRVSLLTYLGAMGETEKLLKKTLQLEWINSKTDVSHAFESEKLARANRREHQTIEFNSVDKLYFSNGLELKAGLKERFNDSIEMLNFTESTRVHINKFVEETTRDRIKDFLPPGSINSATRVVLVNAVFFKAFWKSKFDKTRTHKRTFYEHGHMPVSVDMMTQTGHFNYGFMQQLDVSFLEMPYNGENGSMSMYIFLPILTDIDRFLGKLTLEMLDAVFDGKMYKRLVNFEFPKISFEQKIDLKPVFRRIQTLGRIIDGMDLRDFFEKQKEPLQIDPALHQAKIKIDEGGSEAAAATAFVVMFASSTTYKYKPHVYSFICNRPFMFLIHDKKNREILFAGVYRGPNQQPKINA